MAGRVVDLRSDTVSSPTERMRRAMQRAEVGDSLRGEDPSVNRLQEMAADMLGKEAALFMPSGTMSNLAAIMAHCNHGDRAIVGELSHILNVELGGITSLAGVMPQVVPDADGVPDPRRVETAIAPRTAGRPYTSLVCLENSHNWAGGVAVTPEQTEAVCAVAKRYGIPVHLDGARIFNAAVALGVPARDLVREVNSVGFCLSKGLSAPVGSLLLGRREFIKKAEFARKILGGGMRQVGHMAAAAIVALEDMVDRLVEDHENARHLARLLGGLPGIAMTHPRVDTNLIFLEVSHETLSRDRLMARLDERGVKISASGRTRVRMQFHYEISREDVEYAARVFSEVLETA